MSVEVDRSDDLSNLTAFITPYGLCRYHWVYFGLAYTPVAYPRMMSESLKVIRGVTIDLEDILIFRQFKKEHDEKVDCIPYRMNQKGC